MSTFALALPFGISESHGLSAVAYRREPVFGIAYIAELVSNQLAAKYIASLRHHVFPLSGETEWFKVAASRLPGYVLVTLPVYFDSGASTHSAWAGAPTGSGAVVTVEPSRQLDVPIDVEILRERAVDGVPSDEG